MYIRVNILILKFHLIINIFSYLGDNASVDAVSSRLREVCPNLYRNEDAVCSKVR